MSKERVSAVDEVYLREIEARAFEVKNVCEHAPSLDSAGEFFERDLAALLLRDIPALIAPLRRNEQRIAELEQAEERWRKQLNHIHAYCEDYAHDITTSHKMLRAICEIVGVEMEPDR